MKLVIKCCVVSTGTKKGPSAMATSGENSLLCQGRGEHERKPYRGDGFKTEFGRMDGR